MGAPRWLRLLTALVALGAGSGCPGETQCLGGPPPDQRTGERLFGVGEALSFRVLAGTEAGCTVEGDTSTRHPESVTVQVHGPENQPIPATAELTPNSGLATIRFTPPVTGRYHVLVAFAPVGSLQQFGIFVAEDRRREAPLARLSQLSGCRYLDRTRQGTWLCGARAVREVDGTPQGLGTSSELPMVVAGDVVWTVDMGQVRRFADTGSGPLQPTGTAPFPGTSPGGTSQAVHTLLASEDELLVHGETLLYRYTFTPEGGISSAPAASVLPQNSFPFGPDSVMALLVRAGTRLLVVSRNPDSTTFEGRTRACAYEARSATESYSRVLDEPCQTLEGEPAGFEDGVLWTRTSTFVTSTMQQTLRRYVVEDGRLKEEGVLTMDGQLTVEAHLLRPGAAPPMLYGGGPYAVPRWSPEKHQLELELAPILNGVPTSRRGARYFWLDAPIGGGVAVFPRVRPSNP